MPLVPALEISGDAHFVQVNASVRHCLRSARNIEVIGIKSGGLYIQVVALLVNGFDKPALPYYCTQQALFAPQVTVTLSKNNYSTVISYL